MQHFIAFIFPHILYSTAFSIVVLVGCFKSKPPKTVDSTSKKIQVSGKSDPAPSSHLYVDASCQPKSVMATKPVTVTNKVTVANKVKSRSTNPYVKTKIPESPPKDIPPKDMSKELDKLREDAVKEGEKKEEEDFGYENCADMTEDQLKKAKAARAVSKVQTINKTQVPKKTPPPPKAPITYKKPMKT